MRLALLLLVLVVGVAMAEEEEKQPKDFGISLLKALKELFREPAHAAFQVGQEVVIIIALLIFILNMLVGIIKDLVPVLLPILEGLIAEEPAEMMPYASTGYGVDTTYGGYQKRSLDTPPFMDRPLVQRLTQRVYNAIENFQY
ncbi:uncharacterized protein [Procambarus clarkii]|uniref:uncharacterized protein n=1 Tax=Procambarus clarkii TaxID=6728 RepID=UPI001E675BC4|nr:uncharacterized protein LOC123774481 [Procambarus clarkii]